MLEDNTDWGARPDVVGSEFYLRGGFVRRNGRDGIRAGCSRLVVKDAEILDNDQAAVSAAGILLLAVVTSWRIEGGRIGNQAGVTQNYGVDFQVGSVPGVLGADLSGNSSAATALLPVGSLFYGNNGRAVPVIV